MEQITRLVYDLSRSRHIADEKIIEKYFEFFSDEYKLGKYLKNVVISNFKNKEQFLEELKNSEDIDIQKGYTTRGIHRDDFEIFINNNVIRWINSIS